MTQLLLTIAVIGSLGLVTQVVLLRELFALFAGNELSAGIFLSFWLLSEGVGAVLMGRFAERLANRAKSIYLTLGTISALSSVFGVIAVPLSKKMFGFLPGESLNILTLGAVTALVVVLPALSHGALFALGADLTAGSKRHRGVNWAYLTEGAGTFLAALACYFYLIPRLSALGIVCLFAGILLATLSLLAACRVKGMVLVTVGSILMIAGTTTAQHWEKILLQSFWPGHRVLAIRESPYGKIVTLDQAGERLLLYDGVTVMRYPVIEKITIEQVAHLPMLSHGNAKKVLLLGAGLGGIVLELIKYPEIQIIVTQLDSLLVEEMKRAGGKPLTAEITDPKVKLLTIDPRQFLNRVEDSFDLIIIPTNAPTSLSTNRLFSREFFLLCAKRLKNKGAVFTFPPGSVDNLGPEIALLTGIRITTLNQAFPCVTTVGLDLPVLIASKQRLNLNPETLAVRLNQNNLQLTVLTPDYLRMLLAPFRQQMFQKSIATTQAVNQDLLPKELFLNMVWEVKRSSPGFARMLSALPRAVNRAILPALFLLLITTVLGSSKRKTFARALGILTSGFAGAGFSTLAILLYQIRFGTVYSALTLMLAGFMLGTVPGAAITLILEKKFAPSPKVWSWLFLAGELVFLILLWILSLLAGWGGKLMFLLVLLISGAVLGWQFGVASIEHQLNRVTGGRTAGLLSLLDFTGGTLGGFFTAIIFVPIIGVINTVAFLAGLKLISAIGQLVSQIRRTQAN